MFPRQFKILFAALLFTSSVLAAVRPQFEVVPITNLDPTNGYYGFPLRINDAGQVTYSHRVQVPGMDLMVSHSFLWEDGNTTDLGEGHVLGVNESGTYLMAEDGSLIGANEPTFTPYGVNSFGQVVGDANHKAALYSSNGLALFPTNEVLGTSRAYQINTNGVAAGFAEVAEGGRAFLFTATNSQNIGELVAGAGSSCVDINEQDHAAVSAVFVIKGKPIGRVFLYRDGAMQKIKKLPGTSSMFPRALNNHDEVVGTAVNFSKPPGPHNQVAFLHSGGKLYNLTKLLTKSSKGWKINAADDINDAGSIVALATRPGLTNELVLLRRVP